MTKLVHQERRVRHLEFADRMVARCQRRHFIEEYLAGAVTYNLSEYPAPSSIAPTEYDHERLRELADAGVTLIELHEEWNDVLRLYGGDKFTSYDEKGLHDFIDLVHSLGMKVIAYMSTGFFDRRDPDFREEWVRHPFSVREIYYDYAVCSPASASWRAYLLPRLERMLDHYGLDGLYNDAGYDWLLSEATKLVDGVPLEKTEPDIVLPHDPAFEDLLGQVMTMTHARGGISKLHLVWHLAPTSYSKVYDYLWVGELITTPDRLRERTRAHQPYVVPCPDFHQPTEVVPRDIFLNSIPFLQFPLRVDGRPVTGKRVLVKDIPYREPVDEDHWNIYFRAIHDHYVAHPSGPFSYGTWDGVPGSGISDEVRQQWLDYLALYLPMVRPNTTCWIDITESDLFERPGLPSATAASLFANDDLFMVVANFSDAPIRFRTRSAWTDRERGHSAIDWELEGRGLLFLADTLDAGDEIAP